MNIFLSYNRKNKAFVDEIANKLRSFQIGVSDNLFFDQDNLVSGDKWAEEIHEALVNSDACVVFIGEQGIGNWQMKEVLKAIDLLEAQETTFRIIPVIVPHSNRENVQKSFPWFLADTQWIEFTNPSDSDAFQKLVETLQNRAPTPFPIPEGANNPYKGLESFGVDDAAFFFGRTFDINRVFYYHLQLASSQFDKRFLAIIGNSGSGKSSFAKAGLLASLKAGRFDGSRQWLRIIVTPDDNPLLKLATALEKAFVIKSSTDFKTTALQNPETLRDRLEVFSKKVVLLIDQFEEVVSQCKDNENRTAFLANLAEATKSSYLICIITMRSDFYSSFAPYRDFNFLLTNNNYTLAEIDANTNGDEWKRYMRDIISKPARLRGVRIDSQLVDRIIGDLQEINGVLPKLQLALQRLWKEGVDKLVGNDYDTIAGGQGRGITGIIETHANEVFGLITDKWKGSQKVESLFKAIFIRLVEITNSKDDVRKTISQITLIKELKYQFSEEEILRMLVELSDDESRLIRIKRDVNDNLWIDVVHEVLIRKWEKLKGWINERREAFAYRQIIENDINQYERKEGDLYDGRDLKAALGWQKNNPDLTDERIKSFINKSQATNRRWIYGSMIVSLLVIVGGLYYYFKYLPENSGLAKYWKERNYRLEEIHTLETITNLEDLKNLYVFTNLDSLEIDASNQNINQDHINSLPKRIVYLSITKAEIDKTLNFTHIDSLKQLSLSSITKMQSLSLLEGIETVHAISLSYLSSLQSLSGIQAMPNLQNLSLSYLNIPNLSGIQAMPNLQNLSLSYLSIPNLSGIQAMPNLQNLSLSYLSIPNLSGLQAMPNLQTLSLSYLNIPNLSGLDQLNKLKKLSMLNLENQPVVNSQGILALSLDTLVFSKSSISLINFPDKPWKTKVLVYTDVGEDKIVEMAKRYPQTKFLHKSEKEEFNE